jgi:hypothetical protein
VVDAERAGDLDRAVRRPVVDDEHLDDVDPRDLPRDGGDDEGQRLLLVEAGDLHDELHATSSRSSRGPPPGAEDP